MKKKRNTWRSKLTKKEVKHMKDTAGCTTLAGLERNFKAQARMREETPGWEPCWDCRTIAGKLGFDV